MSYNPFHKLIRFKGTKAEFDAAKVPGSLIFAEISDASVESNIAPYYIYANDTEFAFSKFSDFASSITSITGDSPITVTTDGQSVTISHNDSGVVAGEYGSKSEDSSIVFSIPKFTVDAQGHLTAAENLDITIDPKDLGLTGAMHFKGVVSVLPEDVTDYNNGDVVLLAGTTKEYVLHKDESLKDPVVDWIELGDEGSHALKTITISAGEGLEGGGDLSDNRTISHGAVGDAVDGPKATKVSVDKFGHAILGDDLTASDIAYTAGTSTVTAATTNTQDAIDAVVAAVDTLSAAGHNTVAGSDFITVEDTTEDDHTKYTVTAKTTALGDAVGMTYDDATGTWSAADGSVTDGLVTAADVASEIVADEQVIAAALNDHETRIKDLEATDAVITTVKGDDTTYVAVADEGVGNDHDYKVSTTLAEVPVVAVGDAAEATGLTTDAYVKDSITNALAWEVIG